VLPRAAWTISRTGRPGLVGIGLLLAAAMFLLSTHLKVAADIEALRADLAAAQPEARTAATDKVADPATAVRALPARTDMPAILRQLFNKGHAGAARGRYRQVRDQLDEEQRRGPLPDRVPGHRTLPQNPRVHRCDVGDDAGRRPQRPRARPKGDRDGNVEAQIRMTVYTVATGTIGLPGAGPATAAPGAGVSARVGGAPRIGSGRPAHAFGGALCAALLVRAAAGAAAGTACHRRPNPRRRRSVHLHRQLCPEGHPPVFFLAHGDRMIDARVGDQLDGVYQFESAAGGQLVFVYLPLNIRQTLAAGVSH